VLAALASNGLPSASLPAGAAAFGIGLLISWAGIGLRLWCFRTLGRYFTISAS
jgi:protein-S-isoprenylcysteine O-methyltransferase Ste14